MSVRRVVKPVRTAVKSSGAAKAAASVEELVGKVESMTSTKSTTGTTGTTSTEGMKSTRSITGSTPLRPGVHRDYEGPASFRQPADFGEAPVPVGTGQARPDFTRATAGRQAPLRQMATEGQTPYIRQPADTRQASMVASQMQAPVRFPQQNMGQGQGLEGPDFARTTTGGQARPAFFRQPADFGEPSTGSGQGQKPFGYLNGNGREGFDGVVDDRLIPDAGLPTEIITGVLDTGVEGHGILRPKFVPSSYDVYISSSQTRRFGLRPGDMVTGPARRPKENERYWGLLKIEKVNGRAVRQVGSERPGALPELARRPKFADLTPIFPQEKIVLETGHEPLSNRMIDLVAPVGKGQRGMIVSPPKAGKTTIMKDMATGVAKNYPKIHLMAVLIGERPEEVTDIRRHIEKVTEGRGEVVASNFDERAEDQTRAAEIALERAKRLVELGEDVFVLLDSITRLARAYNLAIPTSGRTLSGGFDPAALYPPKRFFGAARNFEPFDSSSTSLTAGAQGKPFDSSSTSLTAGAQGKKGASLTIIGTALVDTGSRMDDLVYEEFKGTGNMELHLDRHLSERRIFPSIDVLRSGTRKEELLFTNSEYQSVVTMRRMLDVLNEDERTMLLVEKMRKTKSNKEFLASLKEG